MGRNEEERTVGMTCCRVEYKNRAKNEKSVENEQNIKKTSENIEEVAAATKVQEASTHSVRMQKKSSSER